MMKSPLYSKVYENNLNIDYLLTLSDFPENLTNAKAVAIIAKYHVCGHGGIGRRTRFRI
jgi:hypothetical protein